MAYVINYRESYAVIISTSQYMPPLPLTFSMQVNVYPALTPPPPSEYFPNGYGYAQSG